MNSRSSSFRLAPLRKPSFLATVVRARFKLVGFAGVAVEVKDFLSVLSHMIFQPIGSGSICNVLPSKAAISQLTVTPNCLFEPCDLPTTYPGLSTL